MEDFCEEFYFWWAEGVVGWKSNLQIEDAAFVWTAHWAIYARSHKEKIVWVDEIQREVWGWILGEVCELFFNSFCCH